MLSTKHGPIGHANLTVYLPAGTTLSIIRAYTVCVEDVEGDINLIESRSVELEDITGRVRLFNAHLKSARRVRGGLSLCNHQYSGVSWNNYQPRRSDQLQTAIEDIKGEVNLDVGNITLEAADLAGTVHLANRHGTTQLHLNHLTEDSCFQLESSSGSFSIFVREDLLEALKWATYTLCGTINYLALKGWVNSTANNLQLMRAGNHWKGKPNLLVKTESGDIRFEKTK